MKIVIISAVAIGMLIGTQLPRLAHQHEGQGAFNYTDPNAKFDTNKNLVNHSTVVWKTVDNVQTACRAESIKRGGNGFGQLLQACSFWDANQCTIITAKKTSIHALGHETLHCFQGAFH
jgi:hypothetical protein